MSGYLISFEGQDATGKTTLIQCVSSVFSGLGYENIVVDEFSCSPSGDYIRSLLTSDRFLRSGDCPDSLEGTSHIISDLLYQDEHEIRPHLSEGSFVLKDRHIDTLFAYQIPKIRKEYPGKGIDELWEWISQKSMGIRIPDLTFLLSISREVQIRRIEERGEAVSEEDLKLLDEMEEIYSKLASNNPDRIITFQNDGDVNISAQRISEIIRERI